MSRILLLFLSLLVLPGVTVAMTTSGETATHFLTQAQAQAACQSFRGGSSCGNTASTGWPYYPAQIASEYFRKSDGLRYTSSNSCQYSGDNTNYENCTNNYFVHSQGCPEGYEADANGQCQPPPPTNDCPDGTTVTQWSDCVCTPSLTDYKICYDGSTVCFSSQCPEFDEPTPDIEEDPDGTEPNGVCESGNWSQFSTDPDCRAPPPNPCPSGDDCSGDSQTATEDHDGDGIPNSNDPDADSDGDGVPNGTDPDWNTPSNPNGDEDGDGVPNADDNDWSGADSDGDGTPDSEDEDVIGETSGGDACNNPPVCDADPVQCAILRDTWKNRCKTDQKISGIGGCDGTFKCEGDPITCALKEQERIEACAAETESDGLISDHNSDYDTLLTTPGPSLDADGELDDLHSGGDIDLTGAFDGLQTADGGYSASCPAPESIVTSFGTMEFDWHILCDAAGLIAPLMRLIALMFGSWILFTGLVRE